MGQLHQPFMTGKHGVLAERTNWPTATLYIKNRIRTILGLNTGFHLEKPATDQVGLSGNGIDLYYGGHHFESRMEHQLSWLNFFGAFN
jgi:hypothetical protein